MELSNSVTQSKPKIILSKINNFWYSNFYFILIALLSFVFWLVDYSAIGMALLLIVGTVVAFTCKDASPMLPLLPLMVISVSNQNFMSSTKDLAVVIAFGIVFAIGIIYNLVHYKQKLQKGKLTLPLALVSIALICGGIGSIDATGYANGILFIFCLGALMLVLYTYAISRMDLPNGVDHKKYFAKIVAVCAVVVCGEVIVAQLRVDGSLLDHVRASLVVGWANRASLVLALVLGLSSVFYLAENATRFHYVWFNLGVVVYACLMLTFGRGGLIFGTLEMLAIAVYLIVKSKHKCSFLLCLATWVLALLIGIIIKRDSIALVLDKMLELGLNSSGRFNIYDEAIKCFLSAPLFGVGIGFVGQNTTHDFANVMFWFHSTPLQILASMGIFGVVCYLVYYIKRIQILKENESQFTLFMALGIIAFEIHCLIDAGTFQPFPYVFYLVIMHAFIEYDTKKKELTKIK